MINRVIAGALRLARERSLARRPWHRALSASLEGERSRPLRREPRALRRRGRVSA